MLKLKSRNPAVSPTQEERCAAEEAFRRGYWHGYDEACDDMAKETRAGKSGKAWQHCAFFWDSALSDWYHEDHQGEHKPPPYMEPCSSNH